MHRRQQRFDSCALCLKHLFLRSVAHSISQRLLNGQSKRRLMKCSCAITCHLHDCSLSHLLMPCHDAMQIVMVCLDNRGVRLRQQGMEFAVWMFRHAETAYLQKCSLLLLSSLQGILNRGALASQI